MIKTYFKTLAKKEKGTLNYRDKDIISNMGLGVRSPNVEIVVTINYKGNTIYVYNTTGTSYYGHIVCKMKSSIRVVAFELKSISHFKNLFFRRKNRFRIKAQNPNIEYFLNHNKHFKILEGISKKEAFDPVISCTSFPSNTILTKYHLEFDDWTEVIEPIIGLYKDLIDEFEKGHLNIPSKSYENLN